MHVKISRFISRAHDPDQRVQRYTKLMKIPMSEEETQPESRYESVQKRTLFSNDLPYGIVYGNGRPIGILKVDL